MNKDQLKTRLQTLPFFKGSIDLKFIEGFMTNDSYIVSDNNNRYVAKIGGNSKHYGVVRSQEIQASKAAYNAGISPKVLYSDNRILVSQYIKSNHLVPKKIREKEILKRIIYLIKIVHKKVVNYLEDPNLSTGIFKMISKKIFYLKEKNSPHTDKLNNFIKDCEIFEKECQFLETVFTHNDLYFKNILDDGNKFWLIDWEFSGFNPPHLDLANVSKNNDFNEDEDNFILEEYYGNTITPSSVYRFQIMKCASLLNETLWGMVSEIELKKDFDYKSYTDKCFHKYVNQLNYFNNLRI